MLTRQSRRCVGSRRLCLRPPYVPRVRAAARLGCRPCTVRQNLIVRTLMAVLGQRRGQTAVSGTTNGGPALAIARLRGKRTCGSLRQMEPLSFCLGLSFSGQLPQETTCYPNCPDADKPRCLFATGSSHFHGSVLNCIRSADRSASKYSRKWFPEDQLFHFIILIETAPGVHPA